MSHDMPLEPGKVFKQLTQAITATRSRFEEYSSGVSKLLRFKDEVLLKAADRKPLTPQQLTSLAVISSSLFLSKTSVEEELKGIDENAKQSLQQAVALPTRAMLLWGQMAMKLLRRLYISENVQMRYRTARMLEIWDMAAASLPPSPDESPRFGRTRGRGRGRLAATDSRGLLQINSASDTSTAAGFNPGSAALLGQANSAANGVESGFSLSADLPLPAFSLQPNTQAILQGATPRQKPPSPTAAAHGQYDRLISQQMRDVPLLQVNPAQMSRSSSHKSASPRPAADANAVDAGISLTAEPTLASFADTEAAGAATHASNAQQLAEGFDRLKPPSAAVDAAGSVPSRQAWQNPDVGHQSLATDITSESSVQDLFGQSSGQQSGAEGPSAPQMFHSMPAVVPARTRSNLRTGSMTLGRAAGIHSATSPLEPDKAGADPVASVLSQHSTPLTGVQQTIAADEELDWQS